MLAIREERNEGKKKPKPPCYVVRRQRCVPPGQAAGKGGRDTVVTIAVLESTGVFPGLSTWLLSWSLDRRPLL